MTRAFHIVTKSKMRLTLFGMVVVLAVSAVAAVAYFTSHGSGSASASISTVNAPTNVVAKAANGSTSLGASPVTITWTAPASGAAPTGYQVKRDNGNSQVTVSCSASPCTDTGVADGVYTYHVKSLYRTSWTSSAADSSSIQVQNQAPTTTHLTSSDNPSVVGEQVTYTATVSSSGSGTPTGTITFKDGTSTISCESGSASFDGTSATCKLTYATTAGSPHAITAKYSGDAHFLDSTSNEVDQAVGKADQTITFTSTAPAIAKVGGPTYTPTATGGGSGNPVTFTVDATASSVCSISGGVVSFQTVGTCVIDADQPGSSDYNTAARKQQSFAVGKGDQTITFISTAPANAKVGGATYTPTATGGGSGNPVTFTIDAAASSVCSISGGVVSFQTVGTCVIDANQAGTANWNAAPQVQQSFAVAKGDQTITFTSTAPSTGKVGTTYTVTATGGGSGNAVTFTIDATASTVCSISGSTVTFKTLGSCLIDATQTGNSNWNAAPQAQQTATATQKGDQTITFTSTSPTDATVGGATYTVAATGGGSGNTLTFAIDVTTAADCSISGSTVSFTAAGTCTIDANQAGNANWNPATQAQQTFTVVSPTAYVTTGTPTTWNTSSATAKAVSYPSGTAQNDLLFLFYVEPSNVAVPSTTLSGWTSLGSMGKGGNVTVEGWYRLSGGESSVTLSAAPGTKGATAWIVRYNRASGYPPNPALAVASAVTSSSSGNNSSTFAPTMATPTTLNNAVEMVFVAQGVATTQSLSSANGFTKENSTSSTPGTGSVQFGIADKFFANVGAIASGPTWSSTTGADWVGIAVAFH